LILLFKGLMAFVMKSALTAQAQANPEELAILTKWLLQETWLCCRQVLREDLTDRGLTAERRTNLEEMYAAFYHQAFYAPVQTNAHIDQLLNDTRTMLLLLKELDAKAWMKFMHVNFPSDAS